MGLIIGCCASIKQCLSEGLSRSSFNLEGFTMTIFSLYKKNGGANIKWRASQAVVFVKS